MDIQFFWERKGKKPNVKSRFNLLLLEHGESFIEDVSVCLYPIPDDYDLYDRHNKSFETFDAIKIQGRLKLCSRSLIFEPRLFIIIIVITLLSLLISSLLSLLS